MKKHTAEETMAEFECSRSNLFRWKRNVNKLNERRKLDQVMSITGRRSLPKKRHETYGRLNKAVMKYFVDVEKRSGITKQSDIKRKAKMMAEKLAKEDAIYTSFSASKGWLRAFMKRLKENRLKQLIKWIFTMFV